MSKQRSDDDVAIATCVAEQEARVPSLLSREGGPTVEEINGFYSSILRSALKLLGADAGCVAWLDRRESDFDTIVTHGYGQDFAWWEVVDYGQGLVSRSAESGEVLFVDNVRNDLDYVELHPGTSSQISIPLADREGVFAVLAVEWEDPATIPAGLEDMAREFANRLAFLLASFNADLLSVRIHETFRLLDQISQQTDDEQQLQLVMDAVVSIVGRGEVAVLRRYGGRLLVTHTKNIDVAIPDDLAIGVGERRGYTCYVAQTRRPYYCKNASDTHRYPEYRQVVGSTKSQYTIPLLFRNELVGVLNIGSTVPYGFSSMDRHLLDLFAKQAANALYYARLISDLQAVAHHVRNQLTRITFMAPSIAERAPRDMKQALEDIFKTVETSKAWISGIVNPLPARSERVILPPLVQEAIGRNGRALEDAQIQISFRSKLEPYTAYEISSEHFRAVLDVVLEKAIIGARDSEKKRIAVSIDKTRGYETDYIRISVADTGHPFCPDDVAATFSPGSRATGRGGTAEPDIGYWMCDRILANYGGYLERGVSPTGEAITSIWLRTQS